VTPDKNSFRVNRQGICKLPLNKDTSEIDT